MSDAAAILADVTSRDGTRVHGAVWAIVKTRDAAVLDALAAALPQIRAATGGIDLGGMLVSNRQSLEFALRKLEFHRDRAGCLCTLYPGLQFYDPTQEAEAGNVRILGVTKIQDKWIDFYDCECTVCGTAFRVKEGESHYTWWDWTPGPAGTPGR